jgi:hypothetical protein
VTKREARPLWLTASCGTPRSRTPCLALTPMASDRKPIGCDARAGRHTRRLSRGDAWRPGQFHFPPFGSGNDITRTSATCVPSPEAFKKSGFCVQTLSG